MAVTSGLHEVDRHQPQAGVILPHQILGSDPGALVAFAQGVEQLGYGHVLLYDHVVGANTESRPGWKAPYTVDDPFHEPFVTCGFLASATTRLEFATAVMVLPQRQTALVAKQAAEVAILSRNRFRLGVGLGWNEVEYEAMGVPWARRAARYADQLELLRALWANRAVSHASDFHTITDAGICPLPQAVPLWLGAGAAEPALRRVAALADGWIPSMRTAGEAAPALARLAEELRARGRSSERFGVQARMILRELPRESWRCQYDAWAVAGATHVALGVHGLGLEGVDDALRLLGSLHAELIKPCPASSMT